MLFVILLGFSFVISAHAKTYPKRVLSFGAHPDDIEIGCGGTEKKLINEGYEVYHVYITSGDAGSLKLSKAELSKVREKEAINAGKVLGIKEVRFLGYPDGIVSFDEKMRAKVINLIREIQPEIIFVHGASDNFIDHKVVHNLVVASIKGAAGPWFQETQGQPWTPRVVYGYEVWDPINAPQAYLDITDSIDAKVEALEKHVSQVTDTQYHEAFKGLARYRGVMSHGGKYAEAFEIIQSN